MERRRRWARRAWIAAALTIMLGATAAAATAAETAPDAILNANAVAYGAYVPFQVNPNVQFYPAYSLSEIDPAGSHGLSGGLYPGFLVDAAAQFYRYGQEARSMLGIAESQWPNPPQADTAATTEFGDKCRFMSMDLFLPEGFARSCRTYWGQYGGGFPLHLLEGATTSEMHRTRGSARAIGVTLPADVTIGSIQSASSTIVQRGRTVVSEASVLMKDIRIAGVRIEHYFAAARAKTDGTRKGSSFEQETEIAGATFAGQEVTIDDSGVHMVNDSRAFKDVNAVLAGRGFEVRLVQGGGRIRPFESGADAGGLVVQFRAASPPEALAGPAKTSCATAADAQDAIGDAIEAQTGDRDVARIQVPESENPLLSDDPDDPAYYDGRHVHLLPRTFDEVNQPVPPAFPCLAALAERDVNIGMTLGTATVRARLEPLPPITLPDFDDDFDDDFGDDFGNRGPDLGVGPVGRPAVSEPDAGGAPDASPSPASLRRHVLLRPLAAGVSRRVSTIYGFLALLPPLLLAGRRGFRHATRN